MYCCLPRIIEQSTEFNVDVNTECLRIVVHGLLHILGYEDSTVKQKETMTTEEDAIIQQITI
jgi:rRNA maturation RNase YbeY